MKITWKARDSIMHNTWEVELARVHTVPKMEVCEHSGSKVRRDTLVLYLKCTEEQLRNIIKDNGKWNIPLTLLGVDVFPLEPNRVFWTWKPPKGYERMSPIEYVAFEIEP